MNKNICEMVSTKYSFGITNSQLTFVHMINQVIYIYIHYDKRYINDILGIVLTVQFWIVGTWWQEENWNSISNAAD